MKLTKKILAVLLAGAMALGILTACSGSAGPLTPDTVTDYLIDMYKLDMATGYGSLVLTEDRTMEGAAKAVLSYVNGKAGEDKYKDMPLQTKLWKILDDAGEDTKAGFVNGLPKKEGCDYFVSCTSTEISYKTELFNQGKTAVTATALLAGQWRLVSYEWKKAPEKWPNDGAVCVVEGQIGGQKCMVAIFRLPCRTYGGGGGSTTTKPDPDTDYKDDMPASSEAASSATIK